MSSKADSILAASCGTVVKAWDPLGQSSSYSKPLFLTDSQRIHSLAWSPRSSTLAYAGDNKAIQIKSWLDGSTNIIHTQFPLHHICFGHEKGSLVGGSKDGTVNLWNYKTQTLVSTVRDSHCPITALATARSPKSGEWHFALSTSSGGVSIYHVASGVPSRLGRVSETGMCTTRCLEFSPVISGNQLLLASGDEAGHLMICDTATRFALFSKDLHAGWLTQVCFGDRSDQVISCGLDGKICGVDLRSSKVDSILCDCPITCLSLHSSSRIIAFGTQNGAVQLRDRRKMNASLLSAPVHPESANTPVSCLKWQMSVGKSEISKSNQRLELVSTSCLESPQSRSKNGATTDLPFSPVRDDVTRLPSMTPVRAQWKRRSTLQSEAVNTVTMKETAARTPNPRISVRSSVKPVELKSPIGAKGGSRVQHSGVRFDADLDEGSSPVNGRSTRKEFMTPQCKASRGETQFAQYSIPAVYRKRPRKASSYAEFTNDNGKLQGEVVDVHSDTNEKETAEQTNLYWKDQYMKLREDMFEMHFQLMSEMRMQSIEFTRRQDEFEKQHQETKEEIRNLRSLVDKKLNDSINFI